MGLLIAGARATGTTGMLAFSVATVLQLKIFCHIASWLITFLGSHPEWREKAELEVEALLTSKVPAISRSQSLSSQLSTIPLEVWESETPILDAIIKETTRIAQPHAAMRRNLGPPIYIDGKIISTGDYVIYPFSDVHLDPEIYPDPWKFNPERKDTKDIPFGYVGWGGGRSIVLRVFLEVVLNTLPVT